ncbi:hypothetical protein CBL_11044 [Carabus blaptoides fortunei]
MKYWSLNLLLPDDEITIYPGNLLSFCLEITKGGIGGGASKVEKPGNEEVMRKIFAHLQNATFGSSGKGTDYVTNVIFMTSLSDMGCAQGSVEAPPTSTPPLPTPVEANKRLYTTLL